MKGAKKEISGMSASGWILPIYIVGDPELSGFVNKTGGNGDSWPNAIIIEDMMIDGGHTTSGIEICNTTLHLIIRNCTVKDAGMNSDTGGIVLSNCTNVNVTNCSVRECHVGIIADSLINSAIHKNEVWLNTAWGIRCIGNSMNTEITQNIVRDNNQVGIYIDMSSEILIDQNNITNNVEGIYASWCQDCVISSNNVIDNYGDGIDCTNVNATNITLNFCLGTNNAIDLSDSYENTINNNTIMNGTGRGFFLSMNSSKNTVEGNDVSYMVHGIELYQSANNNSIVNNLMLHLNGTPIMIVDSSYNTISHNNIQGLAHGIMIGDFSNYNVISYNTIRYEDGYQCIYDQGTGNTLTHNTCMIDGQQDIPGYIPGMILLGCSAGLLWIVIRKKTSFD